MKPVSGRKSPVLYLLGILTVLLCPEGLQALCPKPEISNGKLSVEKDQYVSSETVTARCDPGYRMVGSQNIFCSENKSWSPDVPKCEKVSAEVCEAVLKGQKLLQCHPNAMEAKVVLELHKLSLEIEKLEQEKRKLEIA
ncbi:zona pellucida sperm-binding protein 3 receptor-like isoform X2 [Bubalus kerabau]|uniref:zona pellucida sperm-binding protein 3 receptor-like isoform X2 n=1 Tax=Bubalus carabanensis TaxID=3119969 RepID=UPI00244E9C5A|nr:zona pellucida sperm-binding protein 3 receptor-like isoform X2 [Bubalus carabanensis]